MAPSKSQIADVFAHLTSGNTDGFFSFVESDVEWTVMSQSNLGGTYNSVSDFRKKTLGRLQPIMDPSTPIRFKIQNIIGGGPDEEWCTIEMKNEGMAKTGARYDQTYAWCVKWAKNESGEDRIVQVRAYLDTGLVDRVIDEHND